MRRQCLVFRYHGSDARFSLPSPVRQPQASTLGGRLVVAHGQRGSAGREGPPGPAGGSAVQRIAGESLSALRYCYERAGQTFVLDFADRNNIDLAAGLTLSAADRGGLVNLQLTGPVDDLLWSWTPGPLWLGAAGALTQQPPTTGFLLQVGTAVSPTRIILNPSQPIELA